MSGTYLELCVPQVLLITVARQSEIVNGSISMMQDACDDVSLRSQARIQRWWVELARTGCSILPAKRAG